MIPNKHLPRTGPRKSLTEKRRKKLRLSGYGMVVSLLLKSDLDNTELIKNSLKDCSHLRKNTQVGTR